MGKSKAAKENVQAFLFNAQVLTSVMKVTTNSRLKCFWKIKVQQHIQKI